MNKRFTVIGAMVHEETLYRFLCLSFAVLYCTSGILLPLLAGAHTQTLQKLLFGVSQIRADGVHSYATIVVLAVLFLAWTAWTDHPSARIARLPDGALPPGFRIGFALLAIGTFFLLRNNFINVDGLAFQQKFMRDIPLRGAHVTHDEMWELYLHSKFWLFTNQQFGWSVAFSYQVLSCLAGGAFVFLLLTYCPILFPKGPLLAFAFCISGGYMQLFFGDVENYTITAVWLMGYFLSSALYIERTISVVWPSVLLAVALTFHLLCGFLIPSLLYLYLLSRRRKETREFIKGAAFFALIPVLTLAFFHWNGLPIAHLWERSNAFGAGGSFFHMLAAPTILHIGGIMQLLLLLVPALALLFPLILYKRVPFDPINIHLLLATSVMAVFVFIWRPMLGILEDWNLFANFALPVSFLIWRNVLRTERLQSRFSPIRILAALFFIHSFSWVIANHFR